MKILNTNLKIKVYKIIFIIIILSGVATITLIGIKYLGDFKIEKENKEILETFSKTDFSDLGVETQDTKENYSEVQKLKQTNKSHFTTTLKQQTEINGYKIIGIISIPKINIKYPILEVENPTPEDAKGPMKYGIIKYWGKGVNDYGNLSLAGHNKYNGTMFGKLKNLSSGDIVELTNLNKITIRYEINHITKTTPNDVSILQTKDNSIRELTLITCTNGTKERRVVKAKEQI